MKILTSEEAKNYDCCMMNKKCVSDQCMAWTVYKREVIQQPNEPELPLNKKYENTDKGFCGV